MYSPQLLEYFESASHCGDLVSANVQLRVENPVCGDMIEFFAYVDKGVVQEIRYKAKGCVPAMACASAACHLVSGKSLEAVSSLNLSELAHAVGGVPPASDHALKMVIEALRKLSGASENPGFSSS